eukprot:TRINITY_DN3238_c0_g1_i1.p1 TRINITY_DN3238_c0_g1~~TRINITY_DN3238_c0_g1_i1.p1  ORF type:complete len:337 (+),score=32.70 TRINITY_DN3238_c0_g1_i1:627-1637(+)
MSWRGLIWTVTPGLFLYNQDYGWTYLFSGSLMGLIYFIAWLIPSTVTNFNQGTPLAEFMWGFVTWLVLLSMVLSWRYNSFDRKSCKIEYKHPDHFGFGHHTTLNKLVRGFSIVFLLVMIISTIWWGTYIPSDMEHGNTWGMLGMSIQTAALLLVVIYQRLAEINRREIEDYNNTSLLHQKFYWFRTNHNFARKFTVYGFNIIVFAIIWSLELKLKYNNHIAISVIVILFVLLPIHLLCSAYLLYRRNAEEKKKTYYSINVPDEISGERAHQRSISVIKLQVYQLLGKRRPWRYLIVVIAPIVLVSFMFILFGMLVISPYHLYLCYGTNAWPFNNVT